MKDKDKLELLEKVISKVCLIGIFECSICTHEICPNGVPYCGLIGRGCHFKFDPNKLKHEVVG